MRPTTLLMIPIAITAVLVLGSCSQTTNSTSPAAHASAGLKNYSVSFSNGTLDYAVNVTVPSPCIDPIVQEDVLTSNPVQVLINITYSTPDPNAACAQAVSHKIASGRITTVEKPGSVTIVTPTRTYEASV